MKIKFYIVILAFLILQSCGDKGNLLSGKLTNAEGKVIYLDRFENNFPIKVDSCIIGEDGGFEIHFPNKPDFYRLSISPNDAVILILDSTDTPIINGDGKQLLATYTIKGAKNSELIHEFFKKTNEYNYLREQFRNELAIVPLEDSIRRDKILADVEQAKINFTKYRHDFIDNNSSSPALMTTMNQMDPVAELDYLKKIESAVAIGMRGSEYHKMMTTTVAQIQNQIQLMEMQKSQEAMIAELLKPGTAAPEITLSSPEGRVIKLSSLRGKYVLIDFWASWCGPCRKENPTVVGLYNKYRDRGFDIYSVSLDKDKEKWIQAIQQDGLVWSSHVSDLMMWNSSVVPLYGINSIPFTVLLDKSGNVIATNLRGEQLTAKLQELLGA